MGMVAELERAGRVEALRENRDHIHMMALPRRAAAAGDADRGGDGRRAAGIARGLAQGQDPAAAARAAKRAGRSKVSAAGRRGDAAESGPRAPHRPGASALTAAYCLLARAMCWTSVITSPEPICSGRRTIVLTSTTSRMRPVDLDLAPFRGTPWLEITQMVPVPSSSL